MPKYKVTVIVETYVTADTPDDAELDMWDNIDSRLMNAEVITEKVGGEDE
jgi:hypothetical protein